MSQIVVSIPSPKAKLPAIFAFSPAGLILCIGCFRRRDTLAPGETIHSDGYVSTTGAALCKACCLTLPLLPRIVRLTWPDTLTARDTETLWDMVRKEQIVRGLDASECGHHCPEGRHHVDCAVCGRPVCLGALSDDQLERALMRAKIDRAPITHVDCHRVAVTA